MGTGWKGIATGALTLLALETLVQEEASSRVGELFAVPGRVARRFLDPSIPAIPERGASSTSSSSSVTPAVATRPSSTASPVQPPGWPTGGTPA